MTLASIKHKLQRTQHGILNFKMDSLTDTDSEAKDAQACEDVSDEVGLAGSDEGSSLAVMLVVVG